MLLPVQIFLKATMATQRYNTYTNRARDFAVSKLDQDEQELLYTTMVGAIMAAIFAMNADADPSNFSGIPGPDYPFPDQTRVPAVKTLSAIGGFLIGVFFISVLRRMRWAIVRLLLTYRDWLYNPRSKKTKAWAFLLSLLLPRQRKRYLYAFQKVLPKYPLPSLEYTCNKALETIRPLVTEKEYEEICEEMENFKKTDGPKLQAVLEKRYDTEENWVADLWDKFAYFSGRYPLLYTNFASGSALLRKDLSPATTAPQCVVAANVTYQHLRFYELIKERELNVLLVQNLVPICSHRYKYQFACTRIPGAQMDQLRTYPDSKHIIAIRKGVMYRVNVYGTDEKGEETIISPLELQGIFEQIVKETAQIDETQWNPAIFTAQNRTVWAQERERMLEHAINRKALLDVESAIAHVSLDDSSPEDMSTEEWTSLCGNGFNRWFDKSNTFIVYENGKSGCNTEHSTIDATLQGRAAEYAYAHMAYDDNGNAHFEGARPHVFISQPEKIEWDLSAYKFAIPKYLRNLQDQCNNIDLHTRKLYTGKGAIKKCRVSPDSFLQMSIQLAFYRMHKKTPKTYETAMTRFFKFGRTETIRTVSMDSKAFTEAMEDETTTKQERIALLKKAMAYHNQYKLDAMNGRGADRPMFGLFCAAKMTGAQPKLFQIPILTALDQMSTSQSPFVFDHNLSKKMTMYPGGGAFTAQTDDGYGCFYMFIGEDHMTIHVSSYHSCAATSSKKFADNLELAMKDIRELYAK